MREGAALGQRGREHADPLVRRVLGPGVRALLFLEGAPPRVEAGGLAGQRAMLLGEGVALAAQAVALGQALLEPRGERAVRSPRLALELAQRRQRGLRRAAGARLELLDAAVHALERGARLGEAASERLLVAPQGEETGRLGGGARDAHDRPAHDLARRG